MRHAITHDYALKRKEHGKMGQKKAKKEESSFIDYSPPKYRAATDEPTYPQLFRVVSPDHCPPLKITRCLYRARAIASSQSSERADNAFEALKR